MTVDSIFKILKKNYDDINLKYWYYNVISVATYEQGPQKWLIFNVSQNMNRLKCNKNIAKNVTKTRL